MATAVVLVVVPYYKQQDDISATPSRAIDLKLKLACTVDASSDRKTCWNQQCYMIARQQVNCGLKRPSSDWHLSTAIARLGLGSETMLRIALLSDLRTSSRFNTKWLGRCSGSGHDMSSSRTRRCITTPQRKLPRRPPPSVAAMRQLQK